MEFFRVFFKILAALVGLPLTLGGFIGIFYGIFVIFGKKNTGGGILIVVASIAALIIGTIFGKLAKGDYD